MSIPTYSAIDYSEDAGEGDEGAAKKWSADIKRPSLATIYSRAQSSYRWTRDYARESLVMAKINYNDTRKFTKQSDWKEIAKHVAQNTMPWLRGTFWPICRYSSIHIVALCIPIAFILCTRYIGLLPSRIFSDLSQICQPDGTFNLGFTGYNGWKISDVFQITIAFGSMPFTGVKGLDVLWDIVVGRGLQAIFALLCYKVFTQSMQRTMERSTVPYGAFEALTFNTASISQIFKLLRAMSTKHGVRGKIQLMWMILASAFVVAFSTLASAMSGYTVELVPRASLADDAISVALSDIQVVPFIIHDFWRLGLTTPYVSYIESWPMYNDLCLDYFVFNSNSTSNTVSLNLTGVPEACHLLLSTYFYTAQYGLDTTKSIGSSFQVDNKAVALDPPTLNITSPWAEFFPYEDYESENGSLAVPASFEYRSYEKAIFMYQNTTYTFAYIQGNGQCAQSDPPSYQWGFSFLLLFITSLLTAVWSVGMYIMWLDAHLNSRYNRARRQLGSYRAVLDLAKAFRQDMGEDATEHLSNSELKERIKHGTNGHAIGYEMLDQSGSGEKALPLTRWESLKLWHRFHGWKTWSLKKRIVIVGGPVLLFLLTIVVPVVVFSQAKATPYYEEAK